MYIIIKRNDNDTMNIVNDPSTGEPMTFDEMLEAENFADQFGFSGPGVEVIDVDIDALKSNLGE